LDMQVVRDRAHPRTGPHPFFQLLFVFRAVHPPHQGHPTILDDHMDALPFPLIPEDPVDLLLQADVLLVEKTERSHAWPPLQRGSLSMSFWAAEPPSFYDVVHRTSVR